MAGGQRYVYWSLEAAESQGVVSTARLPACVRVLLENVLRCTADAADGRRDVSAFAGWIDAGTSEQEIGFYPSRVLMPDSSGVPLIADLAAMRDAVLARGGRPERVNPVIPVDLVIDHAGVVDAAGRRDAYDVNLRLEFERNRERYVFLRWAQRSFTGLRVVPPGRGIVHQVNLEYLAQLVCTEDGAGVRVAYPDTLVGMDSHTPMINSLGVVGWGVGGIEAAAAMLGEPISLVIPPVLGCRITGEVASGVTATDIVLALTERLRRAGVVGRFIEFHGDGLDALPLAHRATIANMTPEMGATVSFFPVDGETLAYLAKTGRPAEQVALVEAYAKAQGLWRSDDVSNVRYTEMIEVDLSEIEPSVAGPRRPQDRVSLDRVAAALVTAFPAALSSTNAKVHRSGEVPVLPGDVVIAAITSCTNTSNPHSMLAAGLVARNLRAHGLRAQPWVKTSLSPGSRAVMEYLRDAEVHDDLEALGFHLVGYGCMTCSGASGRLADEVSRSIEAHDLVVAAVLSGNRNFEGRIHPLVRASFLASPALVVVYAVVGTVKIDLTTDPLGTDPHGRPVYLRDVWPSDREVQALVDRAVTSDVFRNAYDRIFDGGALWNALPASAGTTYEWDDESTYIRRPPFLELPQAPHADVHGARPLLMLGDGITTDHISPVSDITSDSPAGRHLAARGVVPSQLNSLLSRRANHEVMLRGTFANKRLRNELVHPREGGYTRAPDGSQVTVFEAAERYARDRVPLIVVAGADYGTGSSRDWAAKGTRLLGVVAVIAESFERIHRSNLVAMGVLPLQFAAGTTRKTLALTGDETFTINGLGGVPTPGMQVTGVIGYADGTTRTVPLRCRLDMPREVAWYRSGGILPFVLERLLATSVLPSDAPAPQGTRAR